MNERKFIVPKEMKESIAKIVGSKFYIWFLTFCIVVITTIWLYQMEGSGALWARATGGVAVLPLSTSLHLIVKTKKDKSSDEAKLKLRQENHAYKLEKLRIKHNITKGQ